MLIRASIVLLVILNVGVAAWWIVSPKPTSPDAASMAVPSPRLQLVSERTPARSVGSVARAPAIGTATALESKAVIGAAAAGQCVTVGPFADASALAVARAALQPRTSRMLVRPVTSGRKGWRVWLPPLADRDSALAMAARIDAAGFKDYYILPSGDEANGIALGRFGSEAAARRQQSILQAAGFPVQAESLGATTQWLDLVIAPNSDLNTLRRDSGAPQLRVLDCAQLGDVATQPPRVVR